MFDLHGIDRLAEWKNFRDQLEKSSDPLQETIDLWSRAPFVSPYLNPREPASWPDPWQLIINGKLDDLAISLGIFYTLSLTTRFMDEDIEIHMSMSSTNSPTKYPVILKNKVLNWSYRLIDDIAVLDNANTVVIHRNKNKNQ